MTSRSSRCDFLQKSAAASAAAIFPADAYLGGFLGLQAGGQDQKRRSPSSKLSMPPAKKTKQSKEKSGAN